MLIPSSLPPYRRGKHHGAETEMAHGVPSGRILPSSDGNEIGFAAVDTRDTDCVVEWIR